MKRHLAMLLCFAMLVTSVFTPLDLVTLKAAAAESETVQVSEDTTAEDGTDAEAPSDDEKAGENPVENTDPTPSGGVLALTEIPLPMKVKTKT